MYNLPKNHSSLAWYSSISHLYMVLLGYQLLYEKLMDREKWLSRYQDERRTVWDFSTDITTETSEGSEGKRELGWG